MSAETRLLKELFGLDGEVAVIAGGAGRIGRVLARALACAGAKVAILDLADHAPELAEELQRDTSKQVAAMRCDLANADSLISARDQIEREIGAASVLVNCAQFRGQGFYSSAPENYPREAWDRVIEANLTAVHLACQVFGGRMAARGAGRIINFSSTYGVVSADPRIYGDSGVNSPIAYGVSKAGVIGLTRYLAVHWAKQGVRVNCLVPGGVFDGQGAEFVQNYEARTPLGRMASADDYRGAVLFLASRASDYMTGAVLTVDGGWTAW
jgi:NAD(P)-dependent dehydrogenase (short-subunit alcohol dehydrogenase family)